MTSYYDYVLVAIPLALLGITGALLASGFSLTTAIPLAGLIAVGIIGHAMFVKAPVDLPLPSSSQGSNADTGPHAD